MPDSAGMANEVVMLRGHNVDYGAPITSAIRLGAGVWWKSGQVTSPPAGNWRVRLPGTLPPCCT